MTALERTHETMDPQKTSTLLKQAEAIYELLADRQDGYI